MFKSPANFKNKDMEGKYDAYVTLQNFNFRDLLIICIKISDPNFRYSSLIQF